MDIRPKPSVRALKFRVTRSAQIARIDTDQSQDFLWGRPEIENIPRSLDFTIPFEQGHLEANPMRRQCGSHAARTRTNDGYVARVRPPAIR